MQFALFSLLCRCFLVGSFCLKNVSSVCELNVQPSGDSGFLGDYSSCEPIEELWTPSIAICRDRCLRSESTCLSFNFNCGEDGMYNCRLFGKSMSELIRYNHDHASTCRAFAAKSSCVHEDISVTRQHLLRRCTNG